MALPEVRSIAALSGWTWFKPWKSRSLFAAATAGRSYSGSAVCRRRVAAIWSSLGASQDRTRARLAATPRDALALVQDRAIEQRVRGKWMSGCGPLGNEGSGQGRLTVEQQPDFRPGGPWVFPAIPPCGGANRGISGRLEEPTQKSWVFASSLRRSAGGTSARFSPASLSASCWGRETCYVKTVSDEVRE